MLALFHQRSHSFDASPITAANFFFGGIYAELRFIQVANGVCHRAIVGRWGRTNTSSRVVPASRRRRGLGVVAVRCRWGGHLGLGIHYALVKHAGGITEDMPTLQAAYHGRGAGFRRNRMNTILRRRRCMVILPTE